MKCFNILLKLFFSFNSNTKSFPGCCMKMWMIYSKMWLHVICALVDFSFLIYVLILFETRIFTNSTYSFIWCNLPLKVFFFFDWIGLFVCFLQTSWNIIKCISLALISHCQLDDLSQYCGTAYPIPSVLYACIVSDFVLWFAAPEVVNYEPLGLEADMWWEWVFSHIIIWPRC